MTWVSTFAGACGIFVALFCGARFDHLCLHHFEILRKRLILLLSPPSGEDENLRLLIRLSSSLRAGISLDSALEHFASDPSVSFTLRQRLLGILGGKDDGDFLSTFLVSALSSGSSIMEPLQTLEQALRSRQRLTLKAKGMSAQCRTQAEVLSWLPFVLLITIAAIDQEWFLSAVHHPLSWLLWATAIALSGAGRFWLTQALHKCLSPRNPMERLDEQTVPELILRILCEIGNGKDIESSTEISISKIESAELVQNFVSTNVRRGSNLERLKSIILHCAKTGAPPKRELMRLLKDLQMESEARWEERVQRLPVIMLAPLFLCFFPSALLALAGLIGPFLLERL